MTRNDMAERGGEYLDKEPGNYAVLMKHVLTPAHNKTVNMVCIANRRTVWEGTGSGRGRNGSIVNRIHHIISQSHR